MDWLKGQWGKLDQVWFGKTTPHALAVVRILLGALAFLALIQVYVNFDAFFTEHGLYPVRFAEQWSAGVFRWNPLVWWPQEGVAHFAFWICMAAALMVCVGFWTRISTIVLFLGVTALHHRNPDILNSGDTLLRQYLFLLALAPCGAALSLDRWFGLKKGTIQGPPPEISVWPQRLFQFQLAIVYFTTVWWKMMGSTWRDGTATWYPPRLQEFDRFPYPPFIDELPMVYVSTYGTLIVELALATLVFAKPMRRWVVLAGAGMHAWIEYSMNIPFFSAIIVSSYVVYYEGDEVRDFLAKVAKRFSHWKGMTFVKSETLSEDTV